MMRAPNDIEVAAPQDDDIPDYYGSEYSGQPAATPAKAIKPAPSKKSPKKQPKARKVSPLDVIDNLDTIGGFHHDGPFDAASSHRNQSTSSRNPSRQAPMLAFDPSALDPVAQMRLDRASLREPRSAPILGATASSPQALEHPSRMSPRHLHPYSPTGISTPPVYRRTGSDHASQVTMGFPVGKLGMDPKAAKLAEAFGIQDREAWEDFGQVRYAPDPSRESVFVPESAVSEFGLHNGMPSPSSSSDRSGMRSDGGISKRLDRSMKVASVWDMEATLKQGRPVGVAPPVPALPPMPAAYASLPSKQGGSAVEAGTPRRSKSLINRFRKGNQQNTTNPNTGTTASGGSDEGAADDGAGSATSPRRQRERSSSAAVTSPTTSTSSSSNPSSPRPPPAYQHQRHYSHGNRSSSRGLVSPKSATSSGTPMTPLSPMYLQSSPKLPVASGPSSTPATPGTQPSSPFLHEQQHLQKAPSHFLRGRSRSMSAGQHRANPALQQATPPLPPPLQPNRTFGSASLDFDRSLLSSNVNATPVTGSKFMLHDEDGDGDDEKQEVVGAAWLDGNGTDSMPISTTTTGTTGPVRKATLLSKIGLGKKSKA